MKKFYLLLSAVTALIFSCGQNLAAQSPKTDYKVLVLGDLHFDGMEYHKTPAVSANRAKERKRNCDMWKEATPQLLSIAAKQVDNTTPFVIQVGDFVQGDCDTIELQEKMITDGFAAVKKYFPDKIFETKIPRNVRLSEAPSYGKPVMYYDKNSKGAQYYEMLGREFLGESPEEKLKHRVKFGRSKK